MLPLLIIQKQRRKYSTHVKIIEIPGATRVAAVGRVQYNIHLIAAYSSMPSTKEDKTDAGQVFLKDYGYKNGWYIRTSPTLNQHPHTQVACPICTSNTYTPSSQA